MMSRSSCRVVSALSRVAQGLPLTSRTAVSSSTRDWRSWKMAGSTMPDCAAILESGVCESGVVGVIEKVGKR
jgi:hypothetical protein